MPSSSPEFWNVIEASFPEAIHAHRLEDQRLKQACAARLESDKKDERWEQIVAASYDERIADYFLNGAGSEELLIAQLQREYKLSEEEVTDAIDKAIGQLSEVTDYGDEA